MSYLKAELSTMLSESSDSWSVFCSGVSLARTLFCFFLLLTPKKQISSNHK
ncbi:hypothetical protein HanRHA438_Chr07g0300341 [Helianthus annuus]|nr:hypothetical protein HanRHA438_Chr07g0300341 [Helianthus annuus]